MTNTNHTPVTVLPIHKLHDFENHPYKVLDNEEMEQLTESIMQYGMIAPIVVRPKENTADEYEIISGHRRVMACEKAGIDEVPAFIVSMDRDAAAIALVDSNLHREYVLPSEKAFAYKMKLEALEHQGKTCGQVGHKSRDTISQTESGRQVQRYIRLTNLIPEILQYVDDGRIAFTPAVELSYLKEQEQYDLLNAMELYDCTPSYSQACRLKKMSQGGYLTCWDIAEIMGEEKANQKERLRIPMERVSRYFPSSFTPNQIEEEIVKLCESSYRRRMSRDETNRVFCGVRLCNHGNQVARNLKIQINKEFLDSLTDNEFGNFRKINDSLYTVVGVGQSFDFHFSSVNNKPTEVPLIANVAYEGSKDSSYEEVFEIDLAKQLPIESVESDVEKYMKLLKDQNQILSKITK